MFLAAAIDVVRTLVGAEVEAQLIVVALVILDGRGAAAVVLGGVDAEVVLDLLVFLLCTQIEEVGDTSPGAGGEEAPGRDGGGLGEQAAEEALVAAPSSPMLGQLLLVDAGGGGHRDLSWLVLPGSMVYCVLWDTFRERYATVR